MAKKAPDPEGHQAPAPEVGFGIPVYYLKSCDQVKEDYNFALKLLRIREEELIKVVRAGPPIGSRDHDTRVCRVMIITVDSPQHAEYLHNYGKGWRRDLVGGGALWVNPDLIKADRDANWRARQLAKNRRQGRGNFRVLDEWSNSPHGSHHSRRPPRQQAGGRPEQQQDTSMVSDDDISVFSQQGDRHNNENNSVHSHAQDLIDLDINEESVHSQEHEESEAPAGFV